MDEIGDDPLKEMRGKDKGKCVAEVELELDSEKEQWPKEGFGNEEAMNELAISAPICHHGMEFHSKVAANFVVLALLIF